MTPVGSNIYQDHYLGLYASVAEEVSPKVFFRVEETTGFRAESPLRRVIVAIRVSLGNSLGARL